jgi:signal peptidase II
MRNPIGQSEPSAAIKPTVAGEKPRHFVLFIFVGLLILGLDQLSKWYVIQNIPLNSSMSPIEALYPYFQFSHVANTGVSFGLFAGNNSLLSVVAIVAALAVIVYAWKAPPESRWFYVALGFVFGGIVGNLLDRIQIGHVTDFVNFNLRPLIDIPLADWYVFNIADLALVCGVVILFILSILEVRQSKPAEAA